jgi:hypothetical protein
VLFTHVTLAPAGGVPQALPQPPQWSTSLVMLTHSPLQAV